MIRRPATGTRRGGFTAIELLVVVGIMGILALMIAPRVLDGVRRNTVRTAANQIISAWRDARSLAVTRAPILPTTSVGAAADGKAFGIAITQDASGARVRVTFDDAASAPQALDADRPDGMPLSKTVVVSTRANDTAVPTPVTELVWYAQTSSGTPLQPSDIPLGRSAPPAGVGSPVPAGTPSVAARLVVHTLDYDPVARKGYAVGIVIYPSGVAVTQEFGR
jgi:prepilin-type N-terminal cleavage/methylation domain-containing protein